MSSEAKATGLIGGAAGVYNPAVAKAGVLEKWNELKALDAEFGTANSAGLTGPQLVAFRKRYEALPVTFQINWAVADLSADDAQKIADELREKINNAGNSIGFNGLPLPRLFNGNAK